MTSNDCACDIQIVNFKVEGWSELKIWRRIATLNRCKIFKHSLPPPPAPTMNDSPRYLIWECIP